MITNQNIQDQALESFKTEQIEIIVFFLDDFQMKSVIEDFDKYIISLVSQGRQHLIHRHAINTSTVDTEPTDLEAIDKGKE